MKISQIPAFLLFASAFAQDDVVEDQAPEPEGEPEPQFGKLSFGRDVHTFLES